MTGRERPYAHLTSEYARLKLPIQRWLASPSALLILGALVRIAFLLTKGNKPSFSDTLEYEAVALQLLGKAHGPVLPRAPLFPALMAVGFLIGGVKNYWAVRWLQLPLGVALISVVQRMGDRVGGKTVGWLAGLGTAVAPTLIFVSSMLYPTALYTLIVTGLTLTALILADEPRAGPAIGFGVLAALGLLTDTVIAAPLSVLVIWLLLRVRAVGPALLRVLGIALVTVLVLLLPYQLLRRQQGGSSLAFIQKSQWVLHFARTDSTLDADRWVKLPAQQTTIILPVRDFLRQEWTLLATQPVAYVHDVGYEFLHFFAPMPDRVQTRNRYNQPWVLAIGAIYFLPMLVFFLIGLIRGRSRREHRVVLALVVAATATFYAFFFTQTRYRIPVEPLMIVLAALGWASFIKARTPTDG